MMGQKQEGLGHCVLLFVQEISLVPTIEVLRCSIHSSYITADCICCSACLILLLPRFTGRDGRK